jgi:hypothetical protein
MQLDFVRRGSLAILFVAACSTSQKPVTSSHGRDETSANGLFQNGLTANGIWANGIWANGIWANGIWANGIWANGIWANGIWANGIWANGIWANGIWANGLTGAQLRSSVYTRKLVQYIYACGMPGAATGNSYATTLDPNAGALKCSISTDCDDGYTCSAQGTCVVPLEGAIGVGVNADGSTWAATGTCDESCQRWVSACVLARTNAYGVHVDISMRAPADAPDAIKQALKVSDAERAAYPLREGAYFGNLFKTTTLTTAPAGFTGTDLPIVSTPSFYACAGPGSNIPEVTKRFCSSQGDQAVIQVPGVCLGAGQELPVCGGQDTDATHCSDSDPDSWKCTFGSIQDCHVSTDLANTPAWTEVITVYLKQPITVCGNGVCEAGEADTTSKETYCPSDCHPGSWAKALSNNWTFGDDGRLTAVDPDGSIVVVSNEQAPYDVTIDNTVSPAIVLGADASPGGGYQDDLVVVKYGPDGTVAWGHRYLAPLGRESNGNVAVAIAQDHSIYVVSSSRTNHTVWLAKLTPDGSLDGSWSTNPVTVATLSSNSDTGMFAMAFDASGNILLTGESFLNSGSVRTATFGANQITGSTIDAVFVAKLDSSGHVMWAQDVIDASATQSGGVWPTGVAADSSGDVLVTGYNNGCTSTGDCSGAGGFLFKFNPAGGPPAWSRTPTSNPLPLGSLTGVTSDLNDATDSIYVTGDGTAGKLASDGTFLWSVPIGYWGAAIDKSGNLIVLGDFYGQRDFGAGLFNAYAKDHMVVAAYSKGGTFLWAKHLPTILGARLSQIGWSHPQVAVDTRGQVNVSGMFAGSMQLDDRMLVSLTPETFHANTFVGSFVEPSLADTTAPVIGDGYDQAGTLVHTVPNAITVPATSSAGAAVFFMPPTAIEGSGAGTNVSCVPAPNTIFRIGTTTVTCTATNALGVASTAQFTVTVRDTAPPLMANVPLDFVSSTPIVTYPSPIASDQVDGSLPVTCIPASGSTFPSGTTTVTCSAADRAGNRVQATFNVTVTAPVDTTPPVITTPASLTIEASGAAGAIATYTASATDNVDGALTPTCTPPTGSQLALGTTTVNCSATDSHGNIGHASFDVNVVDTTPPLITRPANITAEATGPGGAAVSFTATATDIVDGSVTTTCTPVSGSVFALGTTIVNCSATDAHHNTATASFTVTVADTTAPMLTLPATIRASGTQAGGTAVNYTATANDLVDGAVTTTCTPSSGSLFAYGTTAVSCSATDAHGNRATGSFQVSVTYPWSGFLQPINADGSSIFRLGSTIAVKFQLTGAAANITNLLATLSLAKISNNVTGSYNEATSNAASDSGNTFRYDPTSNQYIYNLSTNNLSTGTWSLQINMGDGVQRTINISLR